MNIYKGFTMKTGVLFGASETEEKDKKLNRVTTSFDEYLFDFIDMFAKSKNLSHSEVVYRLCSSKIEEIEEQIEVIKADPQAVAFDLLTK